MTVQPLLTNDYTLLKSVRAVCPRCFAEIEGFDPQYPDDICDGHLVEQGGRVFLRRFCRRHGEVWSLYEEHADVWRDLQQWRVPTKRINPDTQAIFPLPMGYEYGLGPAHQQHSCIYLLDVTSQCNLQCPACYASSSPANSQYLPVESMVHAVKTAIEKENGRLDVVMISGGEPTVHPHFARILEELSALPITRILVNTNGLRIASDDALLQQFSQRRDRVEAYLQFDGFERDTHVRLRGLDLRELKGRAVERLSQARVFTTLVATVDQSNAGEIGAICDFAFGTPFVGGVMFQPLFASGRAPVVDPLQRITTTGVLKRLQAQSGHGITTKDLIALPCSHPDCCSIGYFLRGSDGKYASLASLVGTQTLKQNLSVAANTIAFSETLAAVRAALAGLMSESMTMSRPELAAHLDALCSSCDFGALGDLLTLAFDPGNTAQFVGERVKRITIKHFMDADTLITERLEQCCVHVAGAGNDPVRMPFCAARLFPKVRARAAQGALSRDEVTA